MLKKFVTHLVYYLFYKKDSLLPFLSLCVPHHSVSTYLFVHAKGILLDPLHILHIGEFVITLAIL